MDSSADHNKSVAVILPAGGSGSRLGSDIPKQFQSLNNKPMFMYSLETFHSISDVVQIVLVLPNEFMDKFDSEIKSFSKVIKVSGGAQRWESVYNGFSNLKEGINTVVIHDVARPFVETSIIEKGISKTKNGPSHIVAIPADNTLKRVKGSEIVQTLDRSEIIEVQTPQFFPIGVLSEVYQKNKNSEISKINQTDEAGMVEALGYPVSWIKGKPAYKKITLGEDMEWGEYMASKIKES